MKIRQNRHQSGEQNGTSRIKELFVAAGVEITGRFDAIKIRYGKTANNVRGGLFLLADFAMFAAGYSNGLPQESIGATIICVADLIDMRFSHCDKGFRASLLIDIVGQLMVFSQYMSKGDVGSFVWLGMSSVYYGAGFFEKRMSGKFKDAQSSLTRKTLGNPRSLMSAAGAVALVPPMVESFAKGDVLFGAATVLWFCGIVANAISTSEAKRSENARLMKKLNKNDYDSCRL
ncbi:MAG: hypothetical protein PHX43_01920 [Alphaproteobacteria bacterium]|nr:hypothetical protein [Alphaproteobacteria bacterium]